MTYFAELDDNNMVLQVIVADRSVIAARPGTWVETAMDGSLRKNYAGIGHTYDKTRDAFISPQPYPSWVLDEATCNWKAPKPMPADGKTYSWDEVGLAWVLTQGM